VNWLARRAAAVPPRLRDLALALVLAAANVGTALPYARQLRPARGAAALLAAHPLAVAMTLLVLQALPLIWRSRWPAWVLVAVGAPRVLYDQLGFGFAPLPLGPAIAYYTVMQRCSTGVRWAISAVVLVGVLTSQAVPGHNEPYDFFVAVLVFVAAGMAGILSRTRTAYLAEVEARAMRAEAERDQQAAAAAARERARIARELHDVVAHHVSLMAVQAEAAGSLLPGQPQAAARSVEIIGTTARQALTELRRLLGVLRGPGEQPQAAPSPSLRDIAAVLAQVRDAGLSVRLTVAGSPADLAPGVDLTAYRIVQEALTNALRHSAAARAAVSIRYEPGYVTVSVTDDGPPAPGPPAPGPPAPGPPAPSQPVPPAVPVAAVPVPSPALATVAGRPASHPAPPTLERAHPGTSASPDAQPPAARQAASRDTALPGGFGLAGITERVASCGGTLTVGPTPAGGFAVTARLPAR
jgi:signal transduction histidine kinase